jgi:hypothetical protein
MMFPIHNFLSDACTALSTVLVGDASGFTTKTRKWRPILGFALADVCVFSTPAFQLFFFLYTHFAILLSSTKAKMTPASRPLPAAQPSSFNELHDTGTSFSRDDLSFASGNSISRPLPPLEGSRLSPANISYEVNHTGSYTAKRGQENELNDAFIRLIHKCHRLEEELTKEREAHNLLKYVDLSRALYSVLTRWIQGDARHADRDKQNPCDHARR